MLKYTAMVFAAFACLFATVPANATTGYELNAEAAEQVEQLKDNFDALKKSFADGQAKLTEVEEKIAKVRANPLLMRDPRVKSLLADLDAAGLGSKLANSKTILAGFERGAKSIETGTGDALAKFNEIKGYYDRWNPNSQSPVRPLELVGNSLQKLQDVIEALDPSPDNLLTKPINEFIGFYKESTTAFAGALERTKVAIDARRQDCIGQGCGLGSISGTKEAEFLALGSGDGADTITLIRRIVPPLGPAGELWANQDGSRTYIYQISRTAIADGSVIEKVSGQWFALACGLGEFEEMNTGMRLAYGEVAGVPTLIARCSRDFAPYREAKTRAERYWPLFNPGRDEQFCSTRIFRRAGFGNEPKATVEAAGNDRETFIARYAFRPSVRQKVDAIVPAITGQSNVRGRIAFGQEQSPSAATVALTLGGMTRNVALGPDNTFELDFAGVPQGSRQIGSLRVAAEGHDAYSTDVAIDDRCADLGTIAVDLTPESPANDATMLGLLERIRETEAKAQSLTGQLDTALAAADADMARFDSQLAALDGTVAGSANASGGKSAVAQRIMDLSQQAFDIGPRIVQIREAIERSTLNVCESYERIKVAFDMPSAEAIHSEALSSQASVDQLFAEYQGLKTRLEQMKGEAQSIHDGSPANAASGRPSDAAASLDRLGDALALLGEQQDAIAGIARSLAEEVARAQDINGQAQAIAASTLGEAGLSAQAQIGAINSRIAGLAAAADGRGNALPGKIASRRTALAAARSAGEPANEAAALSSAEREARFVALNSFNASYETALIYAGKIEAAAQGSTTCFGASEAIFAHRQELERLASANPSDNTGPSDDDLVEAAAADAESEAVLAEAEAMAAEAEAEAVLAEAETGPGVPSSGETAVAPGPPIDACTSGEVQAAFARADHAIVNRNENAWKQAIGSISQAGCNSGRLQASIAAGSAVWSKPGDPPSSVARDEPRNRTRSQARRRNNANAAKILGGLIGVAAAIQGSRKGGNLSSVFGGVSRSRPPAPPASSAQRQPSAPSDDLDLAGATTARRAGGSGSTGSGTGQNWCNNSAWKVQDYLSKAQRASAAGNDQQALGYFNQSRSLTVQACRRGCKNFSADFCNGKAAGWPSN